METGGPPGERFAMASDGDPAETPPTAASPKRTARSRRVAEKVREAHEIIVNTSTATSTGTSTRRQTTLAPRPSVSGVEVASKVPEAVNTAKTYLQKTIETFGHASREIEGLRALLLRAEQDRKKDEERANIMTALIRELMAGAKKDREAQQQIMREMRLELHLIKDERDEQRKALRDARTELQEVKRELQAQREATAKENEELQHEIQVLKGIIDRIDKSTYSTQNQGRLYSHAASLQIPSITLTGSESNRARILSRGSTPTSSPAVSSRSIAPDSSSSQRLSKYASIEISLDESNQVSSGDIRKRFEQAIKKHEATNGVKCTGVIRPPGEQANFKFLVYSKEDEERVRNNLDWLSDFPGARLKGKRWYPVKANGVRKLGLFENIHDAAMKLDAARIVSEENGMEVKQVRWLSRDATKGYGSAVIFFQKEDDARYILIKGLIDIGEETAFTTEFKQREPDNCCFRCLRRGHRQTECTNELTCSRCAGPGHKARECTAATQVQAERANLRPEGASEDSERRNEA
jgi:hypothetical protein